MPLAARALRDGRLISSVGLPPPRRHILPRVAGRREWHRQLGRMLADYHFDYRILLMLYFISTASGGSALRRLPVGRQCSICLRQLPSWPRRIALMTAPRVTVVFSDFRSVTDGARRLSPTEPHSAASIRILPSMPGSRQSYCRSAVVIPVAEVIPPGENRVAGRRIGHGVRSSHIHRDSRRRLPPFTVGTSARGRRLYD